MSRKQPKSHASSARAASAFSSFGTSHAAFATTSSQLSYVSEPPDLSTISDPNVVVLFRNLNKRDSTTKAKALEELQTFVSSLQKPVEEGILEAWIKIYPRTSIDNSKAVRQNAHLLLGRISSSAGKRIAKDMPKVVGAWLCGLYDADRSVVEASQTSLRHVFATPEKLQSLRKAYQQPILEYCRDAIDGETPQTLSDERTVSADDAEAKYSRVISACLALVGSLLSNLASEERSKFQADYETLLSSRKVWDFASHSDPGIRRSVHRFLKICIEKEPDLIAGSLDAISKSYLAGALNSDQVGSAYDYIEALELLTSNHPSVWTEHYKSKTSVERRLRQFLKKGSQFGPPKFWDRMILLFRGLPEQLLPSTSAEATELLAALHGGIVRKDEPRLSSGAAYDAYLGIAAMLTQRLSEEEQREVLRELILPIVTQYLSPAEESEWTVPTNPANVASKALSMEGMIAIAQDEWPRQTQTFIDNIKTSAPEQSKDHMKSQDSLIKRANRFSKLQQTALSMTHSADLRAVFSQACASIINLALDITKNRNGKPYGAAGSIVEFLTHNHDLVISNAELRQKLEGFIQTDLPGLIFSPSSSQLVEILYALSETSAFEAAWNASLKAALGPRGAPSNEAALETLLTSPKMPQSLNVDGAGADLQEYIKDTVRSALEGTKEWDSFGRILQSPANLTLPSTATEILNTLVPSLSAPQTTGSALQGLRQIVKHKPAMLKSFLSLSEGPSLLQGLLLASESPFEDIAQEAVAVNSSVQALMATALESKQALIDVIHHGLRDVSTSSVSVETLVDLAKQLAHSADEGESQTAGNVEIDVFPHLRDWDETFSHLLESLPRASLAITNPLAGAVHLVQPHIHHHAKIPYDADGYSAAYRFALYTVKIFQESSLFKVNGLYPEKEQHLLRNVSLTQQLASDNLSLAGANELWVIYNSEVENEASAFISAAQEVLTQSLARCEERMESPLRDWALGLLSHREADLSPTAYYMARAASDIMAHSIDSHGWRQGEDTEIQANLKSLSKGKAVFSLIGFLHAFKEPLAASRACERMCNELVANLTGLKFENDTKEALRQLVLLNAVIYHQEPIAQSIAKQRLIFFVKHVSPYLHDLALAPALRAEVCYALAFLLPFMQDVYGEHWGDILGALVASWQRVSTFSEGDSRSDSSIPYVHGSLRVYAQLRSLTQSDVSNDDLLDAWKEKEKEVAAGLINLLKNSQHFPDEFHQPLQIVNEILGRQIAKVPLEHLEETEELFPLLYVESQPVQQAAFDVLHKQIPATQEQISIDAALEKKKVKLPEELLSLILEAPTVQALGETSFERSMPLALRGYLLSWLLVFDHFEHASYKVRTDYVEHIKEGDYLPGLLDFAFDFLGHARGKPVDVSKSDITTYTPDVELPRRETELLIAHLYYLCLQHIPAQTRSWRMNCKSRAITSYLESWTEKNISPPLISTTLDSVATWASSLNEENLTVKVNHRAREITISYLVDEQLMSMRITLPAAFPLANPAVEGLRRVLVTEQKWQAWLRTSQSAITIFDGSIVDAITTFKRNIEGALKGQTECAICYSIVGSDRKLPDKRCGTCKNLFHKSCLFKWFESSNGSTCPLCRNPFHAG
ncbi:hypothetical protein M011DRAFT_468163 [Sporormia fimetaria CBS 119925]|uniref:E3 ubiquitin-protein ligase listerin n=1 Tax=Sporormia fimetaria CBS 119925 TaxID=1340428 RepID=A0A6A6VCN4_9PLEO|nr:hypothetical protein M011DRAFT_468163 [Sporormia fimetaria CBS 119925]